MITIIVVLLLFLAVQVLVGMAALLFSNLVALGSGIPIEQLSISYETFGLCLFFGEAILGFGLWWWFNRIERPVRAKSETNPEIGKIFKMKPLKHELAVRPVSASHIILAVCTMLIFSIGLAAVLVPFSLGEDSMKEMIPSMKDNPLCILALCVVGPFCEEMVFRVGILRSAFRKGWPVWLSVSLSALLFALIHGNLYQGVPALFSGILLGLLYIRSGDLKLCLPAHVANNTLAFIMMFFPVEDDAVPVWMGCVLIVAAVALTRYLCFPRKRSTELTNEING